MKTSKWLYVRVAVVAMFTTSAPSFADAVLSDDSLNDAPPAFLLLLVFLFPFFSIFIALKREYRFRNPRQNWDVPTWYTNPFSGLTQFLHMGSFCFMGVGLTGLLFTIPKGHSFILAVPAIFGLAIYLALKRFYSRLTATNRQKSGQSVGEVS